MARKKRSASPLRSPVVADLARFLANTKAPIEGEEIERRYKRPRRNRKVAPRFSYAPAPYPPKPRAIEFAMYNEKELFSALDATANVLRWTAQEFAYGLKEILARDLSCNPLWLADIRKNAF